MLAVTAVSTLDNVRESARSRVGAVVRGGSIVLLIAVLVAGATGLLGVRSVTAAARGGGYELELRYAAIARAGLDVPWTLTVRRSEGFTGPVIIAVTSGYFQMFETQGWRPEPSAQTQDAQRVYMTFDVPSAHALVVDYDAYIQPANQRGSDGAVSVWENGTDLVTIPFATRLLP